MIVLSKIRFTIPTILPQILHPNPQPLDITHKHHQYLECRPVSMFFHVMNFFLTAQNFFHSIRQRSVWESSSLVILRNSQSQWNFSFSLAFFSHSANAFICLVLLIMFWYNKQCRPLLFLLFSLSIKAFLFPTVSSIIKVDVRWA